MLFIAVRQDGNTFERSILVHELEFALKYVAVMLEYDDMQ